MSKTRYLVALIAIASLAACASAPPPKDDGATTETTEGAMTEAPEEEEAQDPMTAPSDSPPKKEEDSMFGEGVEIEDNGDAFAADSEAMKKKEPSKEDKAAPVADVEPELVMGAALVTGPMDREEVQDKLARKQNAIKACFAERIKAKGPSGNIILSFNVKAAGTLENVKVAKSTVNDDKIETCVADTVKSVIFPGRKTVKKVTVQVPLLLTAP